MKPASIFWASELPVDREVRDFLDFAIRGLERLDNELSNGFSEPNFEAAGELNSKFGFVPLEFSNPDCPYEFMSNDKAIGSFEINPQIPNEEIGEGLRI